MTRAWRIVEAKVPSLPKRNGNFDETLTFNVGDYVPSLPKRNGNLFLFDVDNVMIYVPSLPKRNGNKD